MNRTLAVLAASIGAVACDRITIGDRTIVVEVFGPNDAVGVVSRDEIELSLARIRRERGDRVTSKLPEKVVSAVLSRHIEHRILLMEAERFGIKGSTTAADSSMQGMIDERGRRAFASALISSHHTESEVRTGLVEGSAIAQLLAARAHAKVRVEAAEVRAAYESLSNEEKQRKERARVRHIVVRTREEGSLILERLRKNSSFAELARKHSIAPESASGGDLGWIERGTMPAVFEEWCFKLGVGTLSPLVASEYGFHLFLVEAREPARAFTFEELRDRLERDLWTRKLDQAEREYLEEARNSYRVVTHESALQSIR